MVKVCILNLNDCYNNEDWYINNFSFKSVKDAGIEHEIVSVKEQEELFKLIEMYVEPNETSILNITDLYYDKDYVFQSIYKSSNDTKLKTYNGLGSQLTRSHNVDGNMILIKRLIVNSSHEYVDFTFNDLHKLIRHIFVHNAIIINPDNSMEDFPFITDVLESVPDKKTFETIRYHEYKFLDYTLLFYCDISVEQTPENLNRFISTIYRKKVYGKVFVTLTDNNDEQPQLLDLDINTMKEIHHLHGIEEELDHTKYARKFDLSSQEKFPQINYDPNFFSIIHREYEKKLDIKIKTDVDKFTDVLNNIK
jgi:hypothetical protein